MDGMDKIGSILDNLLEQEYDVVVTAGHCIVNQMPADLQSVKLVVGKTDLMASITLAIQSIDSANKKKKIRWMQTIIDNIEKGILTWDSNGNVEF